MHRKSAFSIALAVALAGAAPLAAQMATPARLVARIDSSPSEADQLHQRGLAYSNRGTVEAMREAAHLHELSAQRREAGDLQSARCLREAAQQWYALGDVTTARKLMAQSAERAALLGDVVTAADSYLDAAWLSSELRDYPLAREYTSKAKLLAVSPLLTDVQRTSIRSRAAE